MSDAGARNLNEGKGVALLWVVALLGPVVWLLQLQVNYLLAYWVCRSGSRLIYPLVGLVALAVLAWGGWLSARFRREGEQEEMDDRRGRIMLMTRSGIFGAGFFGLLVIATSIPGLFPGGCM